MRASGIGVKIKPEKKWLFTIVPYLGYFCSLILLLEFKKLAED